VAVLNKKKRTRQIQGSFPFDFAQGQDDDVKISNGKMMGTGT
jgi:hypothetical protein